MLRIAIAELAQETDSFSPLIADQRDFEAYGLYYGEELLERMRGVGPLGGFLEMVDEQPDRVQLLPILRAWGSAGGRIHDETFAKLRRELIEGLQRSLPLDAVFLSLHGAASSQTEDDVEGAILESVRGIVGDRVPIVVAVDHHANITHRMIANANALIGHETQPHDPPATGRKAGRVLFRTLRSEIAPCIGWRKIPMITPQDQFLTSAGPMKTWFDAARQFECLPRVLDVSPYPMQPWLDVAEGGWSVVVHTDGDPQLAEKLAEQMADLAWSLREDYWASDRLVPSAAVRNARSADRGLILLSDTGDSVYGGAPGDSTILLKALLESKAEPRGLELVPLVDADAVRIALQAGVGSTIPLSLGAKMDSQFSNPVAVTARVDAVSRGLTIDLFDRGICDLGETALLRIGSVRIALLNHRSFAINHPILYTHLGIDLADAQSVVLKTASNFQFFSRWRQGLIRVDSAGTTQSNLAAFTWQRLPRPIYPFDPIDR